MDLFSHSIKNTSTLQNPLTEKIRPKSIDEIIGQSNSIGPGSSLGKLLRSGHLPNLIIWGPPGTGKTTFAQSVSGLIGGEFISVSATDSGAKALKDIGDQAKKRRIENHQKTILFVDEIHRLNKSQQDVLLPYVERADLILIGATTENPSYEINRALLSRSFVVIFTKLDKSDLIKLLNLCERELNIKINSLLDEKAIDDFISFADGDGRRLVNSIEILFNIYLINKIQFPLASKEMFEALQANSVVYGKNSEFKYDLISAFIKSIRGSNPDAALYYMVRMLEGGEDPIYIARRMVILASEDIGNADPRAITLAVSVLHAVEMIGLPEGEIPLAQAATYLASCPKSNRSYEALKKAKDVVLKTRSLEVPIHLRSGKTSLCKSLNYGADYLYPHSHPKGFVDQDYLPEKIKNITLYEPSSIGFEKTIREYMSWQRKK